MPELPEVETTLRGLTPHLVGTRIAQLVVRERRLRWRIADDLEDRVRGLRVTAMRRRGKYIILELENGALLMHLGMSGSFRVIPKAEATTATVARHDHYDFVTQQGHLIRYRDPRRFGCLLWAAQPEAHPRIRELGVEPLAAEFDGGYLYRAARNRKVAVKQLLMDGKVVVGVGNIYASEALFAAGIHPKRAAQRIARKRYSDLVVEVRRVLSAAIASGGSTIRNFSGTEGVPGYFAQELRVYGRAAAPCDRCQTPIVKCTIAQRATFYCPGCQR